jgi:hypothetical protein
MLVVSWSWAFYSLIETIWCICANYSLVETPDSFLVHKVCSLVELGFLLAQRDRLVHLHFLLLIMAPVIFVCAMGLFCFSHGTKG